jgi:carboxylesterase
MPHELKGTSWRQWADAAHVALDRLAERCERVFVAGLSMGGLLALHMAACECHLAPNEGRRLAIDGIVVMSAPSALNDRRTRLVRFARYVVPYYYPLKNKDLDNPRVRAQLVQGANQANGQSANLDDPRERRALVSSVRIPLSAIHELLQLNAVVVRELPRVNVPALFFQGRKDMTVAPDSADALAARLGTADKRVVWYENSGHELPLEPDAPAMFEEIASFIGAHVPSINSSRAPAPPTGAGLE